MNFQPKPSNLDINLQAKLTIKNYINIIPPMLDSVENISEQNI